MITYANYTKDERGKSVRLQFPEFQKKGKTYYRFDGAEKTESEIIKSFSRLKKIESADNWSSSISTLICDEKDVLLNKLMNLKTKEHNHGN